MGKFMSSIEDEEEYELAAEACRQIIRSGAIEGFDVEEDDEDEDSENRRKIIPVILEIFFRVCLSTRESE